MVATLRRRRPRRLFAAACAGLLAAQLALVPLGVRGWPPASWQVVACDVGQGDALVLRTGGADVLVDTGPDPDRVSGCLADLGVHRLALVVLTYLHADHVEGLPGVLRRVQVREIEIGPLLEPSQEWTRVRGWAAEAHVPVSRAWRGERRAVGDASWEVLGPVAVLHGTDSDPNNSSLVMRVQLPALSLLLTGDAEQPEQEQVRGLAALRVDVLKVPHHGSDRQDPAFLASTGARVALTSVGAGNPYGHPSPRVLAALRRAGVAVFRTDEDGSVAVLRRHGTLTVVPRRARRAAPPTAGTGRRDRAPPGT
ncbi:MAG TPA: MBL fold metallo-hydrolase [Frankiaceae bacterium]|nr:MBL fold metallo-hydrolase [Frankiaceae bacterium]